MKLGPDAGALGLIEGPRKWTPADDLQGKPARLIDCYAENFVAFL